MLASRQQNLKEFGLILQIATRYHTPLLSHHHESAHKWASKDLFTDWRKLMDFGCHFPWYVMSPRFCINCLLPDMEPGTFTMDNVCHFLPSFWHWRRAFSITFVLCWMTRVVCSFWDQNCQIWWFLRWEKRSPLNVCIQPARLHTCLF